MVLQGHTVEVVKQKGTGRYLRNLGGFLGCKLKIAQMLLSRKAADDQPFFSCFSFVTLIFQFLLD